MLWEEILPAGRYLDVNGSLAMNGSLKEGANEVNLFDSASEPGSLGKKHANGMKRGGR